MKLPWFTKKKNTNLPEFWKEYELAILQTKKLTIQKTRFVVFDTETTGFCKINDRVLSIGAISLIDNVLYINDNFEVYVSQKIFKPETVKIHGILKNGDLPRVDELTALQLFLKYIKNAVLVGHHVGFDIGMINTMLHRYNLPKLKNKTIDTGNLFKKSKHLVYKNDVKNYTLDELCDKLNISKSDRHTANGDALITAIAFLKILSRLNKGNKLKFKDLLN